MARRKSSLLLYDISNAAEKIITYTSEMTYSDFIDNDITIDAVIRNYEIIGEAAKNVSPRLQHDSPQIDWKRLMDFRDYVSHEYFQVDYEIAWTTKQQYLGTLVDLIEALINILIASGKENYYDSYARRRFRRRNK